MGIDEQIIAADVKRAFAEDVGSGDVSALLIDETLYVEAEIISREPMFVCGQPWVDAVFTMIDSTIQVNWLVKEGTWLAQPATLCKIKGLAKSILTAERTALNFLQTLSATASQTYHYVLKLKKYSAKLLDTRKTIPGLRMAQKYAVACAGGVNHRLGLYDAFLIKENHIKASGSITKAIKQARQLRPSLLVEVEVETIAELKEALLAKPDRILLDNFSYAMLVEAAAINQSFGSELEASGGIDLETIEKVAETGVDYISIGAITKSIRAIDLSLLIRQVT